MLDDDTAVPTSKAVQSYVTGKHYAGSSSDGGAATSADKLNIGNSNIGSATQPVYFDKTTGKPVAITNTIQSNVPADAVFTDTTYTVAEGTANGKIKVTPSSGTAYEVPVHGLGNAAYKGVADTVSTSTDLVTSAAVNTKLASYVPNSDLIGVVDNGVKNLVNLENFTSGEKGGISFVVSDGIITMKTGTVSQTFNLWELCTITLSAGTYTLSGCQPTGSDDSYRLDVRWGNNVLALNYDDTGAEFTLSAERTVTVNIRTVVGYTISSDLTFKPMVTTKAQYDISDKYEPYALGNQVITPELIELCDSGAKNLWDFAHSEMGLSSSITANKTDTSISVSSTSGWGYISYSLPLTAGTYILHFKITDIVQPTGSAPMIRVASSKNGDSSKGQIDIRANGTYSLEFTVAQVGTYYVVFGANWTASAYVSGYTASNLMCCTKDAFGVSSKFVPYRPNWDLVGNTVNYVNDTFRRLDYGSNNVATISVNVSTWQEGTYLVACNNAISNTNIKGTSVYMFTLRHSLNYLLFTKIAEMSTSENSNSNITNMTINNDTITISYEHTGYHSVYAVKL